MDVDFSIDHVGGLHHVETGVVDSLDGMRVASVAEELAWGKAEEVGAAVPLFAGGEEVAATAAAEDGLSDGCAGC